jgi:hypothetical protein
MTRPLIVLPPALAPLAHEKRWVVWKWVTGKNGKRTKPPFRADAPRKHASSTDAATWCDLNTAMLSYTEGRADGVGFELTGSNIAAFDVDHCRDAATGSIHPWAQELVRRSRSYAEVTPSGEGIRIIGTASGPPLHRKFNVPGTDGVSVEIYRGAERYITITGLQIDGAIKQLADIDGPSDAVASDLDGKKQTQTSSNGAHTPGDKKHDLDSLIKDGCGQDFGGDRSRATWYVIHALLKQGRAPDDIVAILINPANGISAHCLDQSRPEDYARKQVEKARQESASADGTDAELERLAKLSAVQYEHERKQAAERLNVRAFILDRLVAAERARLGLDGEDGKQGHAIEFATSEPWPEPVHGAELLDEIAKAIGAHVIMAEHARHACALWVVHSYLLDHFMISPRLAIRSPVKGCGKTTLLDVLSRLVPRPLPAANVSPSAIFRVIEGHRPTMLIDEADTLFGEGDDALRGVLNSGHRRGGAVLRTVGDEHEPRAFATYAATAIALIGALPGTLADRSIDIGLARRKPDEKIAAFRLDRTVGLDTLARQCARWAQDHGERVGGIDPPVPAGLYNRAADNWRPLLAIAEVAGGSWPQRACAAALETVGGDVDEVSRLELLLGDVRDVFDELEVDTVSSAHLIERLVEIVPRPWGEYGRSGKPLTQNKLARLLKPVAITVELVGKDRVRSYKRERFEEAFERYLCPKGGSNRSIAPNADEMGTSEPSQSARPGNGRADWKCEKPNNDGEKSGRAIWEGETANRAIPCAQCGRPGGNEVAFGEGSSVRLHRECEAAFIDRRMREEGVS